MSFKHIIVPIDGSDISFAAAQKAAGIAQLSGAEVTAISLLNEDPFTSADFYYGTAIMKDYFVHAHNNAKNALAQVKKIFDDHQLTSDTRIIEGEVSAEHVIEVAQELNADLIVMGSHGRKGVQKLLLGSFAIDVLQSTDLPVLIIKE